MARFRYVAADPSGKINRGVIVEDTEESVISKLKGMNYIPLEIKEERWVSGRIRKGEVSSFLQELSSLVNAGISLDRGLGILEEMNKGRGIGGIISEVRRDIRHGNSLSEALSHHPRLFPALYTSLIRAGEAGGALEAVLSTLADSAKREDEIRSYLRSVMIYPGILTLVGSAAVIAILIFVTPRFVDIFREMGEALPLPTLILIGVSKFLVNYLWLILPLLLIAFFSYRYYKRSEQGRYFFDKLKLKLPVVKNISELMMSIRFTHSLSTLIRGGVPLHKALNITKDATGNRLVSERLEGSQESVKKGEALSQSLMKAGVFPPLLSHMVSVGEETGRLDETLDKVREIYEVKLRHKVQGLMSLIEPCIILVFGAIVAFIAVSILLPLFRMSEMPF